MDNPYIERIRLIAYGDGDYALRWFRHADNITWEFEVYQSDASGTYHYLDTFMIYDRQDDDPYSMYDYFIAHLDEFLEVFPWKA